MIFACSQDFYCMQLYPNFLTTFKAIPKTVLYLFWAAFLYSSVYCPCYPSEIIRSCAEKFLSYFVFASYLFIDCPWYSYSPSTYHKQMEINRMKMLYYNINCCQWYLASHCKNISTNLLHCGNIFYPFCRYIMMYFIMKSRALKQISQQVWLIRRAIRERIFASQ